MEDLALRAAPQPVDGVDPGRNVPFPASSPVFPPLTTLVSLSLFPALSSTAISSCPGSPLAAHSLPCSPPSPHSPYSLPHLSLLRSFCPRVDLRLRHHCPSASFFKSMAQCALAYPPLFPLLPRLPKLLSAGRSSSSSPSPPVCHAGRVVSATDSVSMLQVCWGNSAGVVGLGGDSGESGVSPSTQSAARSTTTPPPTHSLPQLPHLLSPTIPHSPPLFRPLLIPSGNILLPFKNLLHAPCAMIAAPSSSPPLPVNPISPPSSTNIPHLLLAIGLEEEE
ncbi:unnamed protein product [Closterium sp. Naga37s-1]|nr:unnamed protein product [Closterium sp. Naga37s-1]